MADKRCVVPIREAIREYEDAAVEAAWEGDVATADQKMAEAKRLRELEEIGELYDVRF